jgi:hypothetical protein
MIEAAPYALLLKHLHEDGARDQDIAERIGFSDSAVGLIRRGVTKQIHPQTAHALDRLLQRMARVTSP